MKSGRRLPGISLTKICRALTPLPRSNSFFLSYGNLWCSKATKERITQGVLTDEHSPASVRILGTAMYNSRGFREAFNCPVKEPVCELW